MRTMNNYKEVSSKSMMIYRSMVETIRKYVNSGRGSNYDFLGDVDKVVSFLKKKQYSYVLRMLNAIIHLCNIKDQPKYLDIKNNFILNKGWKTN